MTISDLTLEQVAGYLRVGLDEDDTEGYAAEHMALSMAMPATLTYMAHYTGRSEAFLSDKEDLVYPYLALCAEMYENRQERITTGQYKNEFVYKVLDAYAVNLLPGEAELAEDGE